MCESEKVKEASGGEVGRMMCRDRRVECKCYQDGLLGRGNEAVTFRAVARLGCKKEVNIYGYHQVYKVTMEVWTEYHI